MGVHPLNPSNQKLPVLSLKDLDQVTDMYFPMAKTNNPLEDAWCYLGNPIAVPVEGSALQEFAMELVNTVFEQTKQARRAQAMQVKQLANQIAHARDQSQHTTTNDGDIAAAVNMSAEQFQQLERRLREPRFVLSGHIFRARWNPTIDQECLNVRRLPTKTPVLDEINMPESWKAALQHEYPSGLILICGKHGSGKSHTLAATIKTNLLNRGGFTYMVEDPPEFNLQGRHEHGMCIQTPVVTSWEDALSGSTRIFPTTPNTALVFGEIRDQVCALNAMEQADNGQTVFATMHCGSAIGAIERLATLVSTKMGERQPYKILANTCRCIIHQKIVRQSLPHGGSQISLEGEMLFFPQHNQAMRNLVKDREQINQLQSHMNQQFNQFKQAASSRKNLTELLREIDIQGEQ